MGETIKNSRNLNLNLYLLVSYITQKGIDLIISKKCKYIIS